MKENELERKNTVSAKGQVKQEVYFYGKQDGAPRIMLIGNSITRHGSLPSIGWYGDWGMAASCEENDYVHLVMKGISEQYPNAAFCVVQASGWERYYKEFDFRTAYSSAEDFAPDIIVCTLSANIPIEEFEKEAFADALHRLHTYLAGGNKNVKIFESTSFFDNKEKSAGAYLYGEKYGAEVIPISDICRNKENLAIGLFEHEGIQYHPGDNGMKIIAERYVDALLKNLKKEKREAK